MIDKLIDNFLQFGPLSQAEKEAIMESSEIREFRKGDFLLKEGEGSADSYFVLKGCIRQYSLIDGDEKTTQFFMEDEWVISTENLSGTTTSSFNWVCMEDCTLVTGNEKKAQELFAKFPRLETISRRIVEKAFADTQERILSYQTLSSRERYLALINERPNILQRVPQYQIASYIGVQPESLSRIRKRMAEGSG